jgi:hypothetical protein
MLSVFIILSERHVEDARVHGVIPYRMRGESFEKVLNVVFDGFNPLYIVSKRKFNV